MTVGRLAIPSHRACPGLRMWLQTSQSWQKDIPSMLLTAGFTAENRPHTGRRPAPTELCPDRTEPSPQEETAAGPAPRGIGSGHGSPLLLAVPYFRKHCGKPLKVLQPESPASPESNSYFPIIRSSTRSPIDPGCVIPDCWCQQLGVWAAAALLLALTQS